MKNTKKVVAQVKNAKAVKVASANTVVASAPTKPAKAQTVKPAAMYTISEARGILRLAEKSYIVPSKFSGIRVRGGRILGADIIAHLERVSKPHARGRRSNVRIGRRYASGTVTVVAR